MEAGYSTGFRRALVVGDLALGIVAVALLVLVGCIVLLVSMFFVDTLSIYSIPITIAGIVLSQPTTTTMPSKW